MSYLFNMVPSKQGNETQVNTKSKRLLDDSKIEFPEWKRDMKWEFAKRNLSSFLDGSFIAATLDDMTGAPAQKPFKLRKEKIAEEAKLTEALGLIEESCVQNGAAMDLIRNSIEKRDFPAVMKTLNDAFTKADMQAVQELVRNFAIVVPNQGPQATINARREFLNSLQTMFPAMVLPPVLAMVLLTQTSTGAENDVVMTEAMGQMLRDPTLEIKDAGFTRLAKEIVKAQTIRKLSVGPVQAPSIMQVSTQPLQGGYKHSTAEGPIPNNCRWHPEVWSEKGRHTEAECSKLGSGLPFPTGPKPYRGGAVGKDKSDGRPSWKHKSKPTSIQQQQKSGQSSTSNKVLMVDNDRSSGHSTYDEELESMQAMLDQHQHRHTSSRSPMTFSSDENQLSNPAKEVFMVNSDGRVVRVKDGAEGPRVSRNSSGQFSKLKFSSRNPTYPQFFNTFIPSGAINEKEEKVFPNICFNSVSTNINSEIRTVDQVNTKGVKIIAKSSKPGSEFIFPECAKYYDGDIDKHINSNQNSCLKQFYSKGCSGNTLGDGPNKRTTYNDHDSN